MPFPHVGLYNLQNSQGWTQLDKHQQLPVSQRWTVREPGECLLPHSSSNITPFVQGLGELVWSGKHRFNLQTARGNQEGHGVTRRGSGQGPMRNNSAGALSTWLAPTETQGGWEGVFPLASLPLSPINYYFLQTMLSF